MDLILSAIGLIVTSPIILGTAFFIKKKLGPPVIYKQERPGIYGKPFILYKFRTMSDEKNSVGELLPDYERLKGGGKIIRKLSFDELPQLINVLKGDISLVGPRPLLMEYLNYYSLHQARRHEVRPGITGWAQVNGRNAISWEKKFEYDVWYVENQSLGLDIKILWLTIIKVVKSEGISQKGEVTMHKFKGTQKLKK
ncbi:sugar transferase [uncultured Marinococcus sp.]|uniref:sugar transferase n=1 Tax=uncultured Marinococcus sp. TaxID=487012 RepID=UPI00260DC327|nr:sugar transferase [uncultured Marinococcus sp.]